MQKADGSALTVKGESLVAIRDDASQKAFDREVERTKHPKFNDFWVGFVTLGVANSSGNSSTTSVSTAASAVRDAGRNKLSINFAQIYARQSTTIPVGERPTAWATVRIDRNLSKRIFIYGINAYEYDKFLDLNLRMIAGGGFGYHVWANKKGFFDAYGGGNWNRETYDITSKVKPAVYLTQTRNAGELTLGEEFGYQPMSRLKLNEKLNFFPT